MRTMRRAVHRLKPFLNRVDQMLPLRKWWQRIDPTVDRSKLSEDRFCSILQEIGVVRDATVLLHSSMDQVARRVPEMGAVKFIRIMQRLLGDGGTLLMPTLPFLGRQFDYVRTHDEFDVRRTASRAGLLTEVFRRMADVHRSWHPTHSVAAWGRNAAMLVKDHHRGTAFGENSPYYKIQELGGIVVSVGVGTAFTIIHVAEELDATARAFTFSDETFEMHIHTGTETIRYEVRPHRRDTVRNIKAFERILEREGTLRRVTEGGLQFKSAAAQDFIQRHQALLRKSPGSYFGQPYDERRVS